MELLILLLIIFIFFSSKKSSSKSETVIKTKTLKKQEPKVEKKRYSPGQYKRKPKIDPKSKLDPIEPRKVLICDICGSERMYRENMETCCE